ncbi:MAG TPA: hypothetical protein VM537_35695 [Anaerolineae bacterium]|nr:hypothetical protein [Anaerolineae bacterium]
MPTHPSDPITAPLKLPEMSVRLKELAAPAALASGVATKYWLELKAYPPGSARSLWLYVGGAWRHLDNPNGGTQISVQDAFSAGADRLEVVVWYSGTVIVGLVVRSK